MENYPENEAPETVSDPAPEAPRGYVPRPAWQVWSARIGLVVFIMYLILQYANILQGGQ